MNQGRHFNDQNLIVNWRWLNQERKMVQFETFQGEAFAVWGLPGPGRVWETLQKTSRFLYGFGDTPQDIAKMFSDPSIMITSFVELGIEVDGKNIPIPPIKE